MGVVVKAVLVVVVNDGQLLIGKHHTRNYLLLTAGSILILMATSLWYVAGRRKESNAKGRHYQAQ